MIFSKSGVLVTALLLSLFIAGCEEKPVSQSVSSPVVVKVNGEEITEADVDYMLGRTFSEQDLIQIDSALREKVLQSLVASRAMKQKLLKEIAPEEKQEIDQAVKAYEEELYVKSYLQKHISPTPVTSEMVRKYYEEHPEEFGGEVLRDFELLKSESLTDEQRDKLLNSVSVIRNNKNWKTGIQEFGLQYQQGQTKTGLLQPVLEQAIVKLKEGETSDAFYLDGQVYLVRLNKIHQASPEALANVSDDIRKKLAPMLLREAVKKVTDDILNTADIKYSAVQ